MPPLGRTATGGRDSATLRVIDLLRQYTPAFVQQYRAHAIPQVQSVLGKLTLCRTATLGGRIHECPQCLHSCHVYNSCIDRHCPQCSLIEHAHGQVTFWARRPDKAAGNPPQPYTLTGVDFTRCWSLHILPKGFVKSRCFGGFSCRHRQSYLRRCRDLLGTEQPSCEPVETVGEEAAAERPSVMACPHCEAAMACVSHVQRPSWQAAFSGRGCPQWYDPFGQARAAGTVPKNRPPADG